MNNFYKILTVISLMVLHYVGYSQCEISVYTTSPSCGHSGTIAIKSPLGPGYQYSLNGADYQTSPYFPDLSAGTHFVNVLNEDIDCYESIEVTLSEVSCTPTFCSDDIFWNSSNGEIGFYNLTSGTNLTLCSTGGITLGDIAIDQKGQLWGVGISTQQLYLIDVSDCSLVPVYNLGYANPNALSVLPDGTLLNGGGANNSLVQRFDPISNVQVPWYNFGSGRPNGDFIYIDGYIYVLWFDANVDASTGHIYQVEVDEFYNYIDHIDLGPIQPYAFGLAKLHGELYAASSIGLGSGVTQGDIIKIPLPNVEDWEVIYSSNAHYFYGASSFQEAQEIDVPYLSTDEITTICPIMTVNLNDYFEGIIPTGITLLWFDNDSHSGSPLTTVEVENAGTGVYYAYYYHAASDCYSKPSYITVETCDDDPCEIGIYVTYPSCGHPGAIAFKSPLGPNYTYSIDGVNFQSSPYFHGTDVGTYTVHAYNEANMCSISETVTLTNVPCIPTYCNDEIIWNSHNGDIGAFNIKTSANQIICSTSPLIMGDIGFDLYGQLWGVGFKENSILYLIDQSDCSLIPIATIPFPYSNSLSVLPDGTFLIGSGLSGSDNEIPIVKRYDPATNSITDWHDFGSGRPNGDFIFINDKIYVLWVDPIIDEASILEVTVDVAYNYISHVNLGSIQNYSYGLAKLHGQLYAVSSIGYDGGASTGEIIRVPLPNVEDWETIHANTMHYFWGATSYQESQAIDLPILSSQEIIPTCPETTADLSELYQNEIPAGFTLLWYDNDQHDGAPMTTEEIENAPEGTYYAFFYFPDQNCFGESSSAVEVKPCELPLPIDLLNFSVNKQDKSVALHWTVEQMTPFIGFDIQHSTDGKNWQKIGFEKSKQLTQDQNNLMSFQFIHHQPTNGTNYYRLKQIDLDGSISLSPVRSVRFEGRHLITFPNPVNDVLNISGLERFELVTIYNSHSQEVYRQTYTSSGNLMIDIAHLNDGLYLVKITNQDGSEHILKVIKIK